MPLHMFFADERGVREYVVSMWHGACIAWKCAPLLLPRNPTRRYPTFCDDVAVTIRQLCALPEPRPSGIMHFSGREAHTKYSMALVMARVLGLPTDHVVAQSAAPAAGAWAPPLPPPPPPPLAPLLLPPLPPLPPPPPPAARDCARSRTRAGTQRPRDAHLSCARLEALGLGVWTPFEDAIRAVLIPE
jgi:hypothetical protein